MSYKVLDSLIKIFISPQMVVSEGMIKEDTVFLQKLLNAMVSKEKPHQLAEGFNTIVVNSKIVRDTSMFDKTT